MDFLEYSDATQEVRGSMNPGRLKLTNSNIIFKNSKTGKIEQIASSDIALVNWQRLAAGYGLRIFLENGQLHRFGGFREHDHEKLIKFFSVNYQKEMEELDFSVKGWNWGSAKFKGSVLTFDVGKKTGFEIPLGNASNCTTIKNEVTLGFHQNDDAPVSLMELRFHVPSDTTDAEPAQEFMENVLSKASIIQATGDAVATFTEVQCLTPRGRYDIKVFPSFVQLHGKTFDYKIPMTTVLRLFLLPHRDGRQMFFVVSLDPPIKQGQTRYHFLILLFGNEEEIAINLGLSQEEIDEKYEGKLEDVMKGLTYEVFSKIMKALIQRKITVPGNFNGASGTPAIGCSYKAAAGFMYPLERGFIYVHKPPIHIRFEEISCVNFARSGGSTRSFDFEIETKNGVVHIFSSIEKEEYGKLFDFVTGKSLVVKNRGSANVDRKKKASYKEDLVNSDADSDEPDAYLARVKDEAKERMEEGGGGGSSDDESDVSFNPGESGSDVAEEYDSNPATTSSSDDEEGDSGLEKKPKKEKKKTKSAKTVKEPGTRKRRKPKKQKEEGKPKRPQSSYFLWLNENRENLKKENPGISVTELSKKAGEQWKTITDKSKWEKKAQEAKKEYEIAMKEYKSSGGGKSNEDAKPSKKERKKSSPKKKESSDNSASKKSSPTKQGAFKSKEYISSSDDSSDAEKSKPDKTKAADTKKISKKESEEEEEEMDVSEVESNAGSDAGSDAGSKAGSKAESDAGSKAGSKAGSDAGSKAGSDAGSESGAEDESDAGETPATSDDSE